MPEDDEELVQQFEQETMPLLSELFERKWLGIAAQALAQVERAYPPGHPLRRQALAEVDALATRARLDAMLLRDPELAELDEEERSS